MEQNNPPDSTKFMDLANNLSAFGNPTKLAIIHEVRHPLPLSGIRIPAPREGRTALGETKGRPLARQTIQQHLGQLIKIGVVRTRNANNDERHNVEYILNHQHLFALAESFMALAELRPDELPDGPTQPDGTAKTSGQPDEPHLVLVKGLRIGRTFPLKSPRNQTIEWILGRQENTDICLDHDPYISRQHARITWDGKHHQIQGVIGNRNGTHINFTTLQNNTHTLNHGDLIGLGHTLLLYRA